MGNSRLPSLVALEKRTALSDFLINDCRYPEDVINWEHFSQYAGLFLEQKILEACKGRVAALLNYDDLGICGIDFLLREVYHLNEPEDKGLLEVSLEKLLDQYLSDSDDNMDVDSEDSFSSDAKMPELYDSYDDLPPLI